MRETTIRAPRPAIGANPHGKKLLDLDSLLEETESAGQLDGVILMSGSGDVLAGWSHRGLRQEVLSIMSATLTGSVEMLLEEIRGRKPRQILVEADDRRLLVSRTGDDALLVLVAPLSVSKSRLTALASDLLRQIAALPEVEAGDRQAVQSRT